MASITVARPLAANPTPLGGYAEHDDLQAFERDHRKINGDAAFLQMLGGASDCPIEGSTLDGLLQTV